MIVTLTLNPAVDKYTTVEQMVPEKKLRCTEMCIEAGGGGINVSKAILELGGQTTAIFTCGGVNGHQLRELLNNPSIHSIPVPITGNTRESIVVTENSTGKEYKFIMPGPALSSDESASIKMIIENLENVSYLVFSGSLPGGVDSDLVVALAAIAREKGMKFVVDTSGPALKDAMTEGVYLIKPNMSELSYLAGVNYLEAGEIEEAVGHLVSDGRCEIIVLSMGPSGAMVATRDFIKRIPAPVVKKISTVGAGDSMLAGIVWMLESGAPLMDAVRFGVACGTAATVARGPNLFRKEDAYRFFTWMQSQPDIHSTHQ